MRKFILLMAVFGLFLTANVSAGAPTAVVEYNDTGPPGKAFKHAMEVIPSSDLSPMDAPELFCVEFAPELEPMHNEYAGLTIKEVEAPTQPIEGVPRYPQLE